MTVHDWKPGSDRWLSGVMEAVGVSRLAFITGLDRMGVQVACAIRPGGHVLQVSNGKGLSPRDAAYSAVLEAAELYVSENPSATVWGTSAQVEASTRTPTLVAQEVAGAWVEGTELLSGTAVMVPAGEVFCPPADGPLLGPAGRRWTSNGLGAGTVPDRALLHAVQEVLERNQLALALPQGWTEQFVAEAGVAERWLQRHAPRVHALVLQLRVAGFDPYLFQIRSGEQDPGIPVAAALLFDREEGPVPMAAGYACRLEPEAALAAALLEAAQSRLTDIHGAREDLSSMELADVAALGQMCRAHPGGSPNWKAVPEKRLLSRLRSHGLHTLVSVELEAPVPGLFIRKVVSPQLVVSELL
ncbi:MAG: YcaO-like family protein [Myxococcota bacterium]|nr:YcaO-like family protein [Myxococcota bacterium]